MTTVGIVTGAGRGMGASCAVRLADMVDVLMLIEALAEQAGSSTAFVCFASMAPHLAAAGLQNEAAARPTNDLLVARTPLGREGRPEELASTVAFLLSDEASFINGIDVLVDGGCVAAIRTGSSSAWMTEGEEQS